MTLLAGIRIVPDAKISRYLLDPDHRIGGPKARCFMGFGFARERPEELVSALLLHADSHPVIDEVARAGGMNRVISGRLRTRDCRNPEVIVVWHQANGETLQRLVTAYPA